MNSISERRERSSPDDEEFRDAFIRSAEKHGFRVYAVNSAKAVESNRPIRIRPKKRKK